MLCIRFVHMCITDSVVHKCALVYKGESLLPIVLCCVIKVHWECCQVLTAIYTKCVLILYKLFLQYFYKNMNFPIVLCCDMNVYIPTKFNYNNRLSLYPYTKYDVCQCSLF